MYEVVDIDGIAPSGLASFGCANAADAPLATRVLRLGRAVQDLCDAGAPPPARLCVLLIYRHIGITPPPLPVLKCGTLGPACHARPSDLCSRPFALRSVSSRRSMSWRVRPTRGRMAVAAASHG